MEKYENLIFDEERALYGIKNAEIINCKFDGPADGESALKETNSIYVENCFFNLRYPFWHTTNGSIKNITMTENCRAALWYDKNLKIINSQLGGIKAVRECENIDIKESKINSSEFGWFSNNLKISDTNLFSEYPFLKSKNIEIENLNMKGKYSFQYTENCIIKNSSFDTKDAFWHSKNVTVIDSVIKGEYLAWYSENLKLINCKIIGTQPLCYAKGLILENCQMIDCDLAFEKSEVTASIKGNIISVKNPISGFIKADLIGKIILDEETKCEITTK